MLLYHFPQIKIHFNLRKLFVKIHYEKSNQKFSIRTFKEYLVQLVEHLAYNEKVSGSNPLLSKFVQEKVAQRLEY